MTRKNGDPMARYCFGRESVSCSGYQEYCVDADTIEEAFEIAQETGGEFVICETEVTDLGPFTIHDLYECDTETGEEQTKRKKNEIVAMNEKIADLESENQRLNSEIDTLKDMILCEK